MAGRAAARPPGECHRDAVGNLIWSWGSERPRLLVTAHVDTVFPTTTPLSVERNGDWLVGPGVGDNAAAIAVTCAWLSTSFTHGICAQRQLRSPCARRALGTFGARGRPAPTSSLRRSSQSKGTDST